MGEHFDDQKEIWSERV